MNISLQFLRLREKFLSNRMKDAILKDSRGRLINEQVNGKSAKIALQGISKLSYKI